MSRESSEQSQGHCKDTGFYPRELESPGGFSVEKRMRSKNDWKSSLWWLFQEQIVVGGGSADNQNSSDWDDGALIHGSHRRGGKMRSDPDVYFKRQSKRISWSFESRIWENERSKADSTGFTLSNYLNTHILFQGITTIPDIILSPLPITAHVILGTTLWYKCY